jgi:UDP-N-acetylmuramoylalanine-D-glutamate ligase
VYGVAVAGLATVRALVDRNIDVVAVDDQPTPAKSTALANLGLDLLSTPNDTELAALIDSCDIVVPAPGVPEGHRVVRAAHEAGRRVATELDLAYDWESIRAASSVSLGVDRRSSPKLASAVDLAGVG